MSFSLRMRHDRLESIYEESDDDINDIFFHPDFLSNLKRECRLTGFGTMLGKLNEELKLKGLSLVLCDFLGDSHFTMELVDEPHTMERPIISITLTYMGNVRNFFDGRSDHEKRMRFISEREKDPTQVEQITAMAQRLGYTLIDQAI